MAELCSASLYLTGEGLHVDINEPEVDLQGQGFGKEGSDHVQLVKISKP